MFVNLTEEEIGLHCDYATDHDMDKIDRLRAAQAWLRKLERIGHQHNEQALADECGRRLRQIKRRIRHRPHQKLWSRIGLSRHAGGRQGKRLPGK